MSTNSINLFQEAIDHCRWKKVLHNVLKKIDIKKYKSYTFEEIIIDIHEKCVNVLGLGMLTVYDISAAICRKHKININKVFIIGSGPKRASKLLSLKLKTLKINLKIKLRYADIKDVVKALREKNIIIKELKCGDTLETYICNWQKNI